MAPAFVEDLPPPAAEVEEDVGEEMLLVVLRPVVVLCVEIEEVTRTGLYQARLGLSTD